MTDQGEKIVFLARELLTADTVIPDKKTAHISMSFKALCLTTLLAAAGSSAVTAWATLENQRLLNRYEKMEINALIFYAARLKGVEEHALRAEVERKIGVDHLDNMTYSEFPIARRYLQEKAQ